MKTVSDKTYYWDIAADIYFLTILIVKKYPAIISVHPIGSCKEQTSVVCMVLPAKAGFMSLLLMPVFRKQRWRTALSGKIQQCE